MTPVPPHKKPRVRVIIPVWGMDYVERWLALSFASLRSPGNIGYVNEHCELELAIVTKSSDAALMRADARFVKMMEGLRIKFVSIDEFFPPHGKVTYGMPLTLAYAKAINDLGTDGLGTFIIMVNADFILSSGSLKSVVDRINQGFTIITVPSIRVIDADVRPILLGRVDQEAGVLSMPSREMMGIVNAHLHNTVRARTVNARSFVDSVYYHQIYWRISPDCFVARFFLLMPLCFRIDRLMDKVVCPVDYGFIAETCPEGRYTVITDSDDFTMLELQERDSEAYLLRMAKRASTLGDQLAVLEQEISSQAAGWATAEHRRAITHTLYFHEQDLPADIADRVAPFDAFMTRLLARMPPPVSYIRHFHWLGAVRDYRQRMIRGGASGIIDLLEDPRNGNRPTAEELNTHNVWAGGRMRQRLRYAMEVALLRSARLRGWGRRLTETVSGALPRSHLYSVVARKIQLVETAVARRLLLRGPRRDLAARLAALLAPVAGGNTVAYVCDIEACAPPPPAGASALRFPKPHATLGEDGFRLVADDRDDGATGTLIVHAPLGFIPYWPRLADDVECVLRTYRQMIVVLTLPNYEPARLADYAWLLSLLLGLFGDADFEITLDTFAGQPRHRPLRILLGLLSPRFWVHAPRRLGGVIGGLMRQALSYQSTNADKGPARFGALIIRATRSREALLEPRAAHAPVWAATSS